MVSIRFGFFGINLIDWIVPKLLLGLVVAPVMIGAILIGSLSAGASGAEIEGVSEATNVRFSKGISFVLEVKGGTDIVEVKLNYRKGRGGPWVYTYLHLVPSRHVVASFTLDTSAKRYIPPGAEVEYFFVISDAGGNVVQTDRQICIYADTRFNWQSTIVGSLILMWHDQPLDQVQSITDGLGDSMGRIEDLLGLELNFPVRGVIYNTAMEAAPAFPVFSQTLHERQIFHGFAFPEWDAFTGIGLDLDLITHEIAHLLLEKATGSPVAMIPAWLDEGFASYVESDSGMILNHSFTSFHELY